MSEINKNLQELKNNFSAPRESSVGKKVFLSLLTLKIYIPSVLISFLSRHFDSKLWRKFVHLGINYVRNYNVDVLRCKRTKSYPAVFSFYRYRKFSSSATTLFPFPTIIIVILFIICIEHAKKCTCGLVT